MSAGPGQSAVEDGALSLNFVVLIVASCAIATLGLIENGVAVIIGGMIVAPLISPIQAFAYGALGGEAALVRRSLTTAGVGVSIAIVISAALGAAISLPTTGSEILLVDYANTLRRRGHGKLRAIIESAHTRFRPIVMTSISVVAGNIPLALALEPDSAVRSSLGTVIIGGILSSLILTLVLVPIMYMWLAPAELAVVEVARRSAGRAPAGAVS